MPRLLSILFVIGAIVAMSGCGIGTGEPLPDELAATPETLPTPDGEIVLTIIGAGQPNVGDEVHIDIATIESLGIITGPIYEPFLSEEMKVAGVEVDRLLEAAGVGPDAPLVWRALDGYEVHFTRRQAAAEGAVLVTRIDGDLIDIADGGPIRIVFPDPDGALGRDTNQWIWSLERIEVG